MVPNAASCGVAFQFGALKFDSFLALISWVKR